LKKKAKEKSSLLIWDVEERRAERLRKLGNG
jgi:hypothetical protein